MQLGHFFLGLFLFLTQFHKMVHRLLRTGGNFLCQIINWKEKLINISSFDASALVALTSVNQNIQRVFQGALWLDMGV